jgi:DNA-binding NtrC family response regulator
MSAKRILVVEDDPSTREAWRELITSWGFEVSVAEDGVRALDLIASYAPDIMLLDLRLPRKDGLAVLREMRERGIEVPTIVISGEGEIPDAVGAIKLGAYEYLCKPVDIALLKHLIGNLVAHLSVSRENELLRRRLMRAGALGELVGNSAAMKRVMALIEQVAPTSASVLILGESGTGKELLARLLHYWSDRVGRPFVAVNLKAFADGVVESELFGHEKGAFTGAVAARPGCFERAHGGTLFLDEIGEIGPDVQAKLLRVTQDGEVLPVGGTRPRRIDVRLVTATNRVLRDEVAAGRFREDLYFRLNVIPVQLSPLRERPDDVLPLARHFLARHAADAGRPLTLSPEAEEALRRHAWAGNVRELENAIERAVVLARDAAITPEDLLLEAGSRSPARAAGGGTLQEALDGAAAARIRAALAAADGERTAAARALGVDRTTLYRLMRRLGL